MRVYRYTFLIACATLAAIGDLVLLIVSPAVCGLLFLVSAFAGAVLMLTRYSREMRAPRRRTRRLITVAVILGTTAPACVGLAIALGPTAFLLMLLVIVAGSPYTLRAYARWLRSDPSSSATPPAPRAQGHVWPTPRWPPPLLGPDLQQLSTEELCQAWCASYLVLVQRSALAGTKAMLATVEERQRYLDELERRYPTGLSAWLASAARVASNPLPYLADDEPDPPGINWEELT